MRRLTKIRESENIKRSWIHHNDIIDMIFSSLFGQVLASHDLKMPSDLFIFQNNQFLQFSRAENGISVINAAHKYMTLKSNLFQHFENLHNFGHFAGFWNIRSEQLKTINDLIWLGLFGQVLASHEPGNSAIAEFCRILAGLWSLSVFKPRHNCGND